MDDQRQVQSSNVRSCEYLLKTRHVFGDNVLSHVYVCWLNIVAEADGQAKTIDRSVTMLRPSFWSVRDGFPAKLKVAQALSPNLYLVLQATMPRISTPHSTRIVSVTCI